MATPTFDSSANLKVEKWFRTLEREVGKRESRRPLRETLREVGKLHVPGVRAITPVDTGRMKKNVVQRVSLEDGEVVGMIGYRYVPKTKRKGAGSSAAIVSTTVRRERRSNDLTWIQILAVEYGNKRVKAQRPLARYL